MGVGGGVWLRPVGIFFVVFEAARAWLAVGCVFALVFLWRLRKKKRGFADSRPLWFAYWEPRSRRAEPSLCQAHHRHRYASVRSSRRAGDHGLELA